MQSSMVIAQILGPMYIIVAVGLLLNPAAYLGIFEGILENPAATYFSGTLALIFGLIILVFHHSWNPDWTVVITLMGWAGLIKGSLLILCPGPMARLFRPLMTHLFGLRIWASSPLALGLLLVVKFGPLALGLFLTVKGFGWI